MNPVEVTIKISVTAPEGAMISESTSGPVPMEQLSSAVEEELPVPSKTSMEADSDGEDPPEPLSLEQIGIAASAGTSASDEIPEPISLEELVATAIAESPEEIPAGSPEPEELDALAKLASTDGEPAAEEPPEPGELDALAAKEEEKES